jgi:hypothetical protein
MADSPESLETFLALSAVLTGFSRFELMGAGAADDVWATLRGVLPAGVLDELLVAAAPLTANSSGAMDRGPALEEILDDPKLGDVARSLTVLWYTGRWTALPDAWHAAYGFVPLDTSRVVSGKAYQAGLQWSVAGAHPPGSLAQGFGAWSLPPKGSSL